MGVPKEWQFVDIYGLEPDLLSMVPRPVAAVVLLYPITEKVGHSIWITIPVAEVVIRYQPHQCGVMVSMLASSAVDRGFETPSQVKPKTMKLVFVASLLSMKH